MTIKSAIAAIAVLASGSAAEASVFHAWEVTEVAAGDVLNVRRWPSSQSQLRAAYPNGTVLSLTGRCTQGISLDGLAGQAEPEKRAAVRYAWCEIWHDPARDDAYESGWVYMKYMRPY